MNAITSQTAVLLSRLNGVRALGGGKWLAKCPAHDDGSPSLSLRETEDGRVLIHCFAGCAPDDVCAAIGLGLSDLFPPRNGRDFDANAPRANAPRFNASDLLHLAAFEALFVAISASDLLNGLELTAPQYNRLRQAADTLAIISQECGRHG